MGLLSSKRLCVLAALLTGLAGCGGGSDSSPLTGRVSIALTDAPMDDAAEVVVVFTGVELHSTDGKTSTFDFGSNKKSLDLMKLRDGVTGALTDGLELPAGNYDWMRLMVLADKNSQGESYIKLASGAQYPLWIPSGSETGLKLVRPITIAQGSTTRLIVDFDLRKSIHAPPGQDPNYIMRPTLRLLDQIQVGKITANVDLAALTKAQLGTTAAVTSCKAGLYLFSGAAATPDDQDLDDSDGKDPVFYAPVAYDGANTAVQVNIPFVEAGSYTLAATCNFDVDDANTNDYNPAALAGAPGYQTMFWTTVGNVLVTAGNATVVAIP